MNIVPLRTIIIVLAVVVIGALCGWYYFLRNSENATQSADAARGYNTVAPSFEGTGGSTYQNIASTLGEQSASAGISTTSRLWEVSATPVAGFGWVKGPTPSVYFIERSTGNVLRANTENRAVMRLTDTLRPKTYEADVTEDGAVLERSMDDTGAIITFAGTVASSTGANATTSVGGLLGAELSQGIENIAADPISDTLYFTITQPSGVTLVSTNWKGAQEKQLFSSGIADWRIFAPGDGSVTLLEAPYDGIEGYAYTLKSGSLSLVAEEPGLTLLPRPSSPALLFGTSQSGTLSLFSRSNSQAAPVQLSLATVADKCAWAPGNGPIAYCGVPQTIPSKTFLNDWYKGLVHTTDDVYRIDASVGSTTLLEDPTADANADLDVEDLSVDPSGQYLAFINGADRSLWILRIAQ